MGYLVIVSGEVLSARDGSLVVTGQVAMQVPYVEIKTINDALFESFGLREDIAKSLVLSIEKGECHLKYSAISITKL